MAETQQGLAGYHRIAAAAAAALHALKHDAGALVPQRIIAGNGRYGVRTQLMPHGVQGNIQVQTTHWLVISQKKRLWSSPTAFVNSGHPVSGNQTSSSGRRIQVPPPIK